MRNALLRLNRWAALVPYVGFVLLIAAILGLLAGHPGPGKTQSAANPAANPAVMVGFTGVSWTDISAAATPNIWKFLSNANMGSMLVRTGSMPITAEDGWASFGAGATRVGQAAPDPLSTLTIATISNGLKTHSYGKLAPYAVTTTNYTPTLPAGPTGLQKSIVDDLAAHTQIVIVDAGRLDPATSPERGGSATVKPKPGFSTLKTIDDYVGQVVQAAHVASPQAMIVAASVADDGQPAELRFLASQSAINQPPGLLNSLNTRQAGMAMVFDVFPTMMTHVQATTPEGYKPGKFVVTPMSFRDAAQAATDRTLASNAMDPAPQRNKFFLVYVGLFILCLVPTFLALFTRRKGWQYGVAFALSMPVATYLAMLVPWYRYDRPLLMLSLVSCAIAAVIGYFALKVGRTAFGIGGIAGLVTALVIYTDVVLGSTLQMSAPLGEPSTQGARWYGMGNLRFGLGLTGLIVFLGWQLSRVPGQTAVARLKRTGLVLATGLPCIIIGVAPQWGSDLGGLFGSVPAFMTMLFTANNLKFSLRRMVVILGGMVAAIICVCFLDWLRPPEVRTHLGDLVDQVVEGKFFRIVGSLLRLNLETLIRGANWILPLIYAAAGWWLIRGWRRRSIFAFEPALRGTLLSLLIGGSLGFLANDSGTSLISAVIVTIVPTVMLILRAQQDGELRYAESRIEKLRDDM